jgi:hypothetical protein
LEAVAQGPTGGAITLDLGEVTAMDTEQLGRFGLGQVQARAPKAKALGKVIGRGVGKAVHGKQMITKVYKVNHKGTKSQHFSKHCWQALAVIALQFRNLKSAAETDMLQG